MSALFWVGVGITTTAFASIILVAWIAIKRKPFYLLLLFAAMNLGFALTASQVTTLLWIKVGTVALFIAAAIRSIVLASAARRQHDEWRS